MRIEIRPPQAGNFEDLGGCFMQKMHQNCTQERVFLYKISLNIKKFPPAAGIFAVEIRLVMPLKCIFSRLRRAIIMRLCFMRVYRALLHKHKLCFFCPAPVARPNHNGLVFCVSTERF